MNHMDVDSGDEEADDTQSDSGPQKDAASVTVIREDEPAKEPLDSTAVPKKSALKKSKVSVSSLVQSNIPSNNSSVTTTNFSLPLPSDRYVFSFTPRPPASLSDPDHNFNSSADSDDSDCEDSVKWRDYYGDDERGLFTIQHYCYQNVSNAWLLQVGGTRVSRAKTVWLRNLLKDRT